MSNSRISSFKEELSNCYWPSRIFQGHLPLFIGQKFSQAQNFDEGIPEKTSQAKKTTTVLPKGICMLIPRCPSVSSEFR
ncbi:hypothetical protein Y032_0632g879 [Ancylostoma ceylanicum]|nr:hypothetical protein Y032_0632g879 [Ancylostoma ceylanicum]